VKSERPRVLITGASSGVGRATALAFARRGWAVALIARGRPGLDATAREVESLGGESLVLPLDVADAEAVQAAAERVASAWGGIDVWINNAMATIFGSVESITPAEFRRVTEVTYLGQVHGTLAALKQMRRQHAGTIVQVGSALAYRSIPLQSAYCGAKAAARGFTDSLRSELIHEKSPIRLTIVHLPAINTPQFDWARTRLPRRLQPVPPIHAPEVAAEAIFKASLQVPRELWVGSPTIKAILGTMLLPRFLDGLAARRAWDGQMMSEPSEARPDNLFEPRPGPSDGRGRFASAERHAVVASDAAARGAFVGMGALLIAVLTLLARASVRRLVSRSRVPAGQHHLDTRGLRSR